MERTGLHEWRGVPKDTFLVAAMALEDHFAPGEQVPNDPIENLLAANKRQGEMHLDLRASVDKMRKIDPEGWYRLIESFLNFSGGDEKKITGNKELLRKIWNEFRLRNA